MLKPCRSERPGLPPVKAAGIAVTAIVMAAVLSSCNSRFAADFESDTVGQLPSSSPPGPPGDEVRISFTAPHNPSHGVLARVTEGPESPISGETRYLSLSFPATADQDSVAMFFSSPLATGTQSLFFRWEQILDGDGTVEIFIFAKPEDDDPSGIVCTVSVLNDLIHLDCGSDPVEIDGFDTASLHTALLRIDRSPPRAALSVVQDGASTDLEATAVESGPLPAEGDRVVVQIRYRGQVEGALRINNFFISERDPN